MMTPSCRIFSGRSRYCATSKATHKVSAIVSSNGAVLTGRRDNDGQALSTIVNDPTPPDTTYIGGKKVSIQKRESDYISILRRYVAATTEMSMSFERDCILPSLQLCSRS